MPSDVFNYNMTPSRLAPFLEFMIEDFAVTFVWGAMGLGKTEIVGQLAKKRGARLVAIHLPQFDPSDLKGIPVKIGDTVRWLPTSYLPQQYTFRQVEPGALEFDIPIFAEYRNYNVYVFEPTDHEMASPIKDHGITLTRVRADQSIHREYYNLDIPKEFRNHTVVVAENAILFLDELSAADPTTQNGALQLCNDRAINEYVVPFDVPVLAAGNRECDGGYVMPMSAPLSNRFCHVVLHPSVADYIEWGASVNLRPDVIGYHTWKDNESVLFRYDEGDMTDGKNGFPTPRSWTRMARALDRLDQKNLDKTMYRLFRSTIVIGYIGERAGQDYISYLDTINSLPDINGILSGKIKPKLDDMEIGVKFGFTVTMVARLKAIKERAGYDSDEFKTASENCFMTLPKVGDEFALFGFNLYCNTMKLQPTKIPREPFRKYADEYGELVLRVMNEERQ